MPATKTTSRGSNTQNKRVKQEGENALHYWAVTAQSGTQHANQPEQEPIEIHVTALLVLATGQHNSHRLAAGHVPTNHAKPAAGATYNVPRDKPNSFVLRGALTKVNQQKDTRKFHSDSSMVSCSTWPHTPGWQESAAHNSRQGGSSGSGLWG